MSLQAGVFSTYTTRLRRGWVGVNERFMSYRKKRGCRELKVGWMHPDWPEWTWDGSGFVKTKNGQGLGQLILKDFLKIGNRA
jgi:hypothetical protein